MSTHTNTTIDAKIMIGEVEHEVPDEVAALIEAMKAKIEEQGAKLAELSTEGDADLPTEPAADPAAEPMPAMDAKAKEALAAVAASEREANTKRTRSLDAMEARVAFLEGERTREKNDFGKAVSARVSLLTTAREVLGPVDLDAHADADIKRAVVVKVEPSMKGKLDGKSSDFVEAAFEMALVKHRERRAADSSGALLGLTGAAHLHVVGDNALAGAPAKPIDLNAVRREAMDSLAGNSKPTPN